MAAREVIHFLFSAQLASCPLFPALLPPDPVSESPPRLTRDCGCPVRSDFDRIAIRVSEHFIQCWIAALPPQGTGRFKCKRHICTKQSS